MDATQLYEIAVLVDESPQLLTDAAFTEPIQGSLRRLNGTFTVAAERHGIDSDDAERWLSATERLFNHWVDPGLGEAADIAVRLSALAFILSGQDSTEDIDGVQLLASAPVGG